MPVQADPGEAAHQGHEANAVAGVVVASQLGCGASQAGRRGDMRNKDRVHVGKADGVAEALERLEQHQQREARAGLARALPREGKFGRFRRERLQLGRLRLGGQARVGGVGDDRHGRCRQLAATGLPRVAVPSSTALPAALRLVRSISRGARAEPASTMKQHLSCRRAPLVMVQPFDVHTPVIFRAYV